MPRVAIVGVGAIGGFIGTRLAVAGQCQLSAVARGASLVALQTQGWRLDTAAGRLQASAVATDRPCDLGPQDLVIFAVKGPALAEAARTAQALIGPHTVVLPAMNGVPWWFCVDIAPFGREPLRSVDPDGSIGQSLAYEQVLGCVVHASTSAPEPGLVRHVQGQGLIVGEPAGGRSARAQAIVDLLAGAGFEVAHADNVRYDIWYKLWGNMTMNPISAMTGATVDQVLADPLVRQFCSDAMREAAAIGTRIGCAIRQSPEDRHAVTAKLGRFRTSMLQDVEAGRMLELDALVAAVHEIGTRLGEPMPAISALWGLARLFGRTHGLYPPPKPAP